MAVYRTAAKLPKTAIRCSILAFLNKEDNLIEGMRGRDQSFAPLPAPLEYQPLATPVWMAASRMVPYLYRAYAALPRRDGSAGALPPHRHSAPTESPEIGRGQQAQRMIHSFGTDRPRSDHPVAHLLGREREELRAW